MRKITLCTAFAAMLLLISCKEKNNTQTEPETENLQYVEVKLGGCNLKSAQKDNDRKTGEDTVIITTSEDLVQVFVALNYTCKSMSFETKTEIIDDVLYIHLIDTGGDYMRCMCYYTFDFSFKRQGDINQKYKILLHDNRGHDEIISIFSEGTIVEKSSNNQSNCDQDVIVDLDQYNHAPNRNLVIEDMKILNNCLKIKFSASGCDGNTWVVKLVDMGGIAKSLPPQRTLRLSLDNKEMCRAWITKEISFNIEDLQVEKYRKIWLNVGEKGILYEY